MTTSRRGYPKRSSWRAGLLLQALLYAAFAPVVPVHAEEPLWGEGASTLGRGFLDVTTYGDLRDSKPYRHHGGPTSLTIERMDVVAGVEYGLKSDIDLQVRVPYFSETLKESFAGQSISQPLSGFGEMQVGTRWRFWQSINGRHKDELALLANLKLPTGASNLRDRGGLPISPHLQPNSGHPGGLIGLAANRHTRQGGYWLSGMVSAETASARYGRGMMLELHASTGRRMKRLSRSDQADWLGIVGLHYQWMGKDSENGRTIGDSGGSILSAEVGVVGSKHNHMARLGILLPLRTEIGLAHAPPRREIQASFRASF